MRKKLPPDESPAAWLWGEIARRLGDDAAAELREGFNLRNRQVMLDTRRTRQDAQTAWLANGLRQVEQHGDTRRAQALRDDLARHQAERAAVEQRIAAEQQAATTFSAGQPVIWLSGLHRIHSSHLVDGETVTPTAAEVVTVTGQRVRIRIRNQDGTERLIWAAPRRLRDLDTWAAMIAAGTAVTTAPRDQQAAAASADETPGPASAGEDE
jgi:hypothetical protein